MPRKPPQGLPTRKQILDFIESSGQPAGKREIARAFGLSSHDKIMLKAMLKDMADEGLIDSSPGRAFHKAGGVPKVTVLRVAQIDDGGNVWAVPEQWHADTPAPKLRGANGSPRIASTRAVTRGGRPEGSASTRSPSCASLRSEIGSSRRSFFSTGVR